MSPSLTDSGIFPSALFSIIFPPAATDRGSGIRSTIASRTFSTLVPTFAETGMMSASSHQIRETISRVTRGISALGRSILFRTGIMTRL